MTEDANNDGVALYAMPHPLSGKPLNWRKLKKLARKMGKHTTETVEIEVPGIPK